MLSRMYKTDADIRKRQINTLKVFNANVNEITEGQEYQIVFNSGGNELILNILLGNEFPKEKPVLKIQPVVIHPWVNADGEIVSAPGLLNFTVHSDLGRVVQAIIREFERTPPPLFTHSNKISASIPINEKRISPSFPTLPVMSSFSPPSHVQAKMYFQFPSLNKLSIEELQFLNDNVDRQQEFIEEIQCISDQNRMLDECIAQIEEIAEGNLSKQQQLETYKGNINQRMEEVANLVCQTERLHGIYQALSDKFSPRKIQEQLKIEAGKAEVDSERIAEKFLQGEIDVDRFMNQYIASRKLCQLRKTKEEKLGYQLDSLEKAGF
ncbi:vacuolar protein sorting-associated protein 37A isoform X2 [Aethina tumida]|uniref:vacuolar protein sorting-associated protein 37A isoform X2 n=1 Tax=Aethina tumida TaxID=116153 RepID=UPI00096B28ED|nr:vacuolar protein sorting-associated protein 37A isoform X2 [Aethina tumida]